MKFRLRITAGIILFFIAVAVLASTQEMLFTKGISIIDTEMHKAGDSSLFVRTKMEFGSNEHMLTFPKPCANDDSANSRFFKDVTTCDIGNGDPMLLSNTVLKYAKDPGIPSILLLHR